MQQVLGRWTSLDPVRRIVVAVATVAVFLMVVGLARLASAPGMALLYAGLDPAAAGDVVRALDQRAVAFEVRGDSIWVDNRQRDQLRMSLAGEGLPATGSAGYELLDGLSGFGTTSQMFDAAYMRAKEGELARTIAASPHIRTARVHIALPVAQPFRRDQRATASVSVAPAMGGLPPQQARALKHLVAAAVPGLVPDDVAVIDGASGLVLAGEDDRTPLRAADDRSAELRRNVERLLEARVGPGRALVEISLDLVTERESITERRFDPQARVVISTETEERTNAETGAAQGVTVASNLPEGDAGPEGGSRSQSSESRERVNYEVSETQRAVERGPGAVRRLTVAVLVDGLRDADGGWQPRPDAELADLRELVASATGFDAARGDVITLKSMAFEALPGAGTAAPEAGLLAALDMMALIRLAVVALVVLLLALFVIRPVLLAARRPLPAPPLSLPAADTAAARVLTGEIDDAPAPARLAMLPGRRDAPEQDADDPPQEDPVERLRRLIASRQAESVEILRHWMEEREDAR